jgi:16S rRNA (adenine1518-N6/adenine1519-N6)-dimethyltransferase
VLRAAGVDPSLRGERLSIADFARIAAAGAAAGTAADAAG